MRFRFVKNAPIESRVRVRLWVQAGKDVATATTEAHIDLVSDSETPAAASEPAPRKLDTAQAATSGHNVVPVWQECSPTVTAQARIRRDYFALQTSRLLKTECSHLVWHMTP